MSEITTIICSSCGIVNDLSRTVCSSCGSPLTDAVHAAVPAAPAASKAKQHHGGRPQWLSAVIGVFVLYAVVIVIIEFRQLPSGTVQRGQAAAAAVPQDHVHTDPALIEQITAMEKMVAAAPKNADMQLQFANMLHDAKFYPRAVEQYKKYLALVPDNHDARVDMGICYYETGDLTQAVKEIESVIRKQPKHQMAMFNLGVIHLSAENMAESRKWLERCRDLDPQSTAGLRAQQILQQHQ